MYRDIECLNGVIMIVAEISTHTNFSDLKRFVHSHCCYNTDEEDIPFAHILYT